MSYGKIWCEKVRLIKKSILVTTHAYALCCLVKGIRRHVSCNHRETQIERNVGREGGERGMERERERERERWRYKENMKKYNVSKKSAQDARYHDAGNSHTHTLPKKLGTIMPWMSRNETLLYRDRNAILHYVCKRLQQISMS